MSNAVSSVISDYATGLDHVAAEGNVDDRRYIRLHGAPWGGGGGGNQEGGGGGGDDADEEDQICAENLVISIVACLARAKYKLQISIQVRLFNSNTLSLNK